MSDEKSRDWYDKRLWYLDEWRSTVLPLAEHALAAEKYAVDFSLMTVKTGALLNGGALVALPAFGAFFKVSVVATGHEFYVSGLSFVIGLLASWLSMAAAYWTNAFHAGAIFAARDTQVNTLAIIHDQAFGSDPKLTKDERPKFKKQEKFRARIKICFHILATLFCLVSFGAFIYGAVIGGEALLIGNSLADIEEPCEGYC